MYTLLIILALSGSGKSISTATVDFNSLNLCEQAKEKVLSDLAWYNRQTVLCLKTK